MFLETEVRHLLICEPFSGEFKIVELLTLFPRNPICGKIKRTYSWELAPLDKIVIAPISFPTSVLHLSHVKYIERQLRHHQTERS
jgi:hypothetical protein